MQRYHFKRSVLHLSIGAAHEIPRNGDAIAEVARVESAIENAAVSHATVQHEPFATHVAQQEIEIGRIEGGQAFLGFNNLIGWGDFGDELRAAATGNRVLIRIGKGTNAKREHKAPRRLDAVDIVTPIAPEYAFHVNHPNA